MTNIGMILQYQEEKEQELKNYSERSASVQDKDILHHSLISQRNPLDCCYPDHHFWKKKLIAKTLEFAWRHLWTQKPRRQRTLGKLQPSWNILMNPKLNYSTEVVCNSELNTHTHTHTYLLKYHKQLNFKTV